MSHFFQLNRQFENSIRIIEFGMRLIVGDIVLFSYLSLSIPHIFNTNFLNSHVWFPDEGRHLEKN